MVWPLDKSGIGVSRVFGGVSAADREKISDSTVGPLRAAWHEESEEHHQNMRSVDTGSHKPDKIKSNRSIDTLFRTAYRAQLDMLSLATTKANIMISLNGLLLSVIVILGNQTINYSSDFIVPVAMLLITCAAATVFAILAARPNISRKYFTQEDFDTDHATLLDFEEFTDIDEKEFTDVMMRMLSSRRRVYRNMIAHVYELGTAADKSYRNLFYSYTVFMIGIVLTVVVMLYLGGYKWIGQSMPV